MTPLASVVIKVSLLNNDPSFKVTLSLVAQQSTSSILVAPPKPLIIVSARSVASTLSICSLSSRPGVLKLNLIIKNLKIM